MTHPIYSSRKRTLAFVGAALAPFAVAGGLLALGVSEQSRALEACNAGKHERCTQVASADQGKITNPQHLQAVKEADERAARQVREESERNAEIAEANRRAEEARLARGDWEYSTYGDAATGKAAKQASLTSLNTVNWDFPYSGTQNGYFFIRNHPRYGVDAFVKVQKGQLLCDSYSNTTVLVRFDNGPAKSYGCSGAADHSSDVVFINNVSGLESGIKGALKMFITVNVYHEGQQTFEFKVRGYDRSKV